MKPFAILIFAGMIAAPAFAQEDTVQPAEALESVQDWIQDNIDPDALAELGVDQNRVQQFLGELQKRFQGEYVYDLGALYDTATNILPVLREFEETQPYAVWLQARLDYLTVPGVLRAKAAAASPNAAASTLANPAPELERGVWVAELDHRPKPPGADKYVSRLKPIFAGYHVPPELVWLAEVESSFDPRAKSPAGAVGLFQLMPATAKSLKVSMRPRDDRKDPEKSARAAASYLRYLHFRFDDWRLALAAYNAGETRVARLLKKYNSTSYDAIAVHLPAETQMYVPKVEATLQQREGINLAQLDAPSG